MALASRLLLSISLSGSAGGWMTAFCTMSTLSNFMWCINIFRFSSAISSVVTTSSMKNSIILSTCSLSCASKYQRWNESHIFCFRTPKVLWRLHYSIRALGRLSMHGTQPPTRRIPLELCHRDGDRLTKLCTARGGWRTDQDWSYIDSSLAEMEAWHSKMAKQETCSLSIILHLQTTKEWSILAREGWPPKFWTGKSVRLVSVGPSSTFLVH